MAALQRQTAVEPREVLPVSPEMSRQDEDDPDEEEAGETEKWSAVNTQREALTVPPAASAQDEDGLYEQETGTSNEHPTRRPDNRNTRHENDERERRCMTGPSRLNKMQTKSEKETPRRLRKKTLSGLR